MDSPIMVAIVGSGPSLSLREAIIHQLREQDIDVEFVDDIGISAIQSSEDDTRKIICVADPQHDIDRIRELIASGESLIRPIDFCCKDDGLFEKIHPKHEHHQPRPRWKHKLRKNRRK